MTFTVGGETVVKNITVIPKDFGTVEIEAEPEASEAANTEFRNAVWPLYEQPAREKLWSGGFACPAENYMTLVDFGQTKVTDGKQGSKSNSTKLYTIPGDPAAPPPTVSWCWPGTSPSPATPSSSTTAAGCAATSTGWMFSR